MNPSDAPLPHSPRVKSRFAWKFARVISGGLLLGLLGLAPIVAGGMILSKTLRTAEMTPQGLLPGVAYAIIVSAFGSMITMLVLKPLGTWHISGSTITFNWFGVVPYRIQVQDIRVYSKQLMSGSRKHGIRPYSVLFIERRDGKIFDFSTRLYRNVLALETFLQAQGVPPSDRIASDSDLRIWLGHIGVMLLGVFLVLLARGVTP